MKARVALWVLIALAVIVAAAYAGRAYLPAKLTFSEQAKQADQDAQEALEAADKAAISARKAADSTKKTAEQAENAARDASTSARDASTSANGPKKPRIERPKPVEEPASEPAKE